MKQVKQMLLAIFILTLFLLVRSNVYGQTTTSVNATIKISVCGNGVAEGGEDCDNTDLKGKTCTSLGYGSGTLSCDISCGYNTSACIAATPTPTPTPTPGSTNTTSGTTPTSSPQATSTPPTPTPTSQPISALSPVVQNILPPALRNFDLNGDGRIDASELNTVLALWVSEWKQFLKSGSQGHNQVCDLNHNGTCGIHDFSILLFYVGK